MLSFARPKSVLNMCQSKPSKRKTPTVPTSPSTGVCLHPDNHNTSVDSSSKVYNRLSDVGVQSVYRLRGNFAKLHRYCSIWSDLLPHRTTLSVYWGIYLRQHSFRLYRHIITDILRSDPVYTASEQLCRKKIFRCRWTDERSKFASK